MFFGVVYGCFCWQSTGGLLQEQLQTTIQGYALILDFLVSTTFLLQLQMNKNGACPHRPVCIIQWSLLQSHEHPNSNATIQADLRTLTSAWVRSLAKIQVPKMYSLVTATKDEVSWQWMSLFAEVMWFKLLYAHMKIHNVNRLAAVLSCSSI